MGNIVDLNQNSVEWLLLDPGPRHFGWLGFDFRITDSTGAVVADVAYSTHECSPGQLTG